MTGHDAELLRRTLSEIKMRSYEESETIVDDVQVLNALVRRFRDAAKVSQEKETCNPHISPSDKRRVLGAIIAHSCVRLG